jgi:hypothetical protein
VLWLLFSTQLDQERGGGALSNYSTTQHSTHNHLHCIVVRFSRPRGIGGLPGAVEQLDVGAAAPKALSVGCIETSYRLGDEVVLMLVAGVVWRTRGLASSSLLELPVFAPPTALTASSLRL